MTTTLSSLFNASVQVAVHNFRRLMLGRATIARIGQDASQIGKMSGKIAPMRRQSHIPRPLEGLKGDFFVFEQQNPSLLSQKKDHTSFGLHARAKRRIAVVVANAG